MPHTSLLVPTLETLEFDRVLALIATEAKSDPGKAALMSRRPGGSHGECERSHAELAEMLRFYHHEGLIPMAGLSDIASLFQRETVLELTDSWLIVRAARATQALRETFVRAGDFPRLAVIAERIPILSNLLTELARYFTRDGKLREDASTELRSIRGRIHTKRAAIQRVLNDVMNRNSGALQEPLIVMRADRYCIPVRSEQRAAVPGILHERSGSGASFFIEPMPVVELNNDLAHLLIQEREEIGRITRHISTLLFDSMDDLLVAVATAAQLDALQACAIFADELEATRPEFTTDPVLRLAEARHPLLDERLSGVRSELFGEEPAQSPIVPVTIELTRDSPALIVSGPNAGGKTVALKTAGLLVAMAMSGLPLPASEGSIIPVVDDIHVLIGDDQSVLEHLSTFSAYLIRLKRILEKATARSLVLLDELGSGTDPEEGAALAAAVVEHLLEAGALLIVTTHLSSLKGFAVSDGRVLNASMEFDSDTGKPTYRIISGVPGRSRALEAARMIGLPSTVIDRARDRLGDRYAETDDLLSQLQRKVSEVSAERDEVSRLRADLEQERVTVDEKLAALEKERAGVSSSYRDELERLRDDVQRQLTNEIRTLRELDRAARASVAPQAAVQKVAASIDRALEFISSEQREVRIGDRVEHRTFKVVGDVASITGKRAVLSVGGKKMTVELRDLVPAVGAPASKRPGGLKLAAPRSDDVVPITAELNLIGQRVDDALKEADRFLDRSLLEGRQAVRFIHGFGTGRLRQAVREYLRKHPAVKSWRPGGENEGGDGATVVFL